ncbi:fungal specific transcription factor domain protein [Purpureocillium lavendulum]|uniref:Fungal specific transcription factor domain protein n=1 Tax=Purpureocillium lavendulum TaxID=1247861 RepID=A0AB34FN27_9HYPO|nr:fungal specific transcription factor domain protein [Purpureocillium lavendulum]
MASESQEYDATAEIAAFFSKTSVLRDTCDAVAMELVGGGSVDPVAIQGVCSYTVYAGQGFDYVVQFRLKSLELKMETATLARRIFGHLVPDISFKRQLGEDSATEDQQPLLVYVMTRMRGISRLDFILTYGFPENSPHNMTCRKNVVRDVARFFALAWKAPQELDQASRNSIGETFARELQMQLGSLPARFHTIVRATLASLPSILTLPMALLHKDFGDCNIIVDESSCHLVGVIDWAEAEIAPFGTNLYSIQDLMSKLHLTNGWIRYEDYDDLARLFWRTFVREVGGLDAETIRAIKAARVLGLLRSRGFRGRLASKQEPVPIKDDEHGRYNMMILDGLLLDPGWKDIGI